ncbi:ATP-binding protein [Metabacillus idriensis]|uniref:histidine kinase n=1 Tax=Metabacillus idriensis TaxID=324768 RepID=A0A6I2M9J3_9BACI|nr:ATP-binding protein [Metabacillus idriensis]MCM3598354.1 ATP-binding protein [Metabacillus idriensis]MRX55025.1 two-component sensor histidine kinase [Metabacillus idriensis]OHR71628.1 two-component sensor histidine kinase [Bacillus sp. HMSC76G11]
MLAEKLTLHVLIVLVPVLIYTVILENKRITASPYFSGIIYGIASFLCMIFSFYDYGLYWDLRYVPMVLALLYGGPAAGLIVFIFILLARTYVGGEAILFGYISAFLALIGPFLFSKRFRKYKPKKRIQLSIIIGFWPAVVQLCILLSFLITSDYTFTSSKKLLFYVFIFGILQVIAIGIAAKLLEAGIERKMMKQEIIRTEKLNTIGELAASIAHEVRNPLTVVKGFLQLMEKEKKNDEQYMRLILSEIGRAESILNDYLNFAKPKLKKIEEFQLSEVIHSVVYLLNALAVKQGVRLSCQLQPGLYIETDRSQLKQALVNLIKNAIEATPEGGKVRVQLFFKSGHAHTVISDTGKGMTADQLSKIGTVFYSTKDKGTGLGTTVSLRIIETMKGRVAYKSELGSGTEVTMILPIKNKNKRGAPQ